jgi:lysophospholipase L1-like esterase
MAKLVAIGDSLTQGFQSLAINKVNLSYPAMIAECLGVRVPEYQIPHFLGKGGLPFNIEWLARQLEMQFQNNIGKFDWMLAIEAIGELLDEVEDYWERGKGAEKSSNVLYHNLAVFGFQVADAYNINAGVCAEAIQNLQDDWFQWPSEPRLRTAYKVFNPAQVPERQVDTQLSIAKRIREQDGEIENLILWLGANNCLATVFQLKMVETGDTPPGPRSPFTLWKPKAFRAEYEALAQHIDEIDAKHVYVATVPHVTIPPVTRGIMRDRGRLPQNRTYFDFYTHFFIKDKNFDENRDPYLSRADAEKIDRYIDEYNETIRDLAAAHGWHVVDQCQVLDDLAVRRNHGIPKYPMPPALSDLTVRFFETTPNGKLLNGGLISLDGVHPTTCGYAIAAQEFINVMRAQNPQILDIDFAKQRTWDSLVSHPPKTLDDIFGLLETLEKWFHVSSLF